MAGLVPAIHAFLGNVAKGMDARNKSGHDEGMPVPTNRPLQPQPRRVREPPAIPDHRMFVIRCPVRRGGRWLIVAATGGVR